MWIQVLAIEGFVALSLQSGQKFTLAIHAILCRQEETVSRGPNYLADHLVTGKGLVLEPLFCRR